MPTLVEKAPRGPEWLHEIKWDGYRLSAYLDHGAVMIRTRNGHDWTARFPTIATQLASLPIHSAVIDGEAVVLDDEGRSDFGALQAALGKMGTGKAPADRAVFYAFDLLFLDGHDLRPWSLGGRRGAVESILDPTSRVLMLSEEIEGDGPTIFTHVCQHGLEGIVSKRRDAPHRSGRRNEWRKTKCVMSDTFFVVGYEMTAGALASIRLAYYESGTLKAAGSVGSGLTRASAADLERRLKKCLGQATDCGIDGQGRCMD